MRYHRAQTSLLQCQEVFKALSSYQDQRRQALAEAEACYLWTS